MEISANSILLESPLYSIPVPPSPHLWTTAANKHLNEHYRRATTDRERVKE